MLTNNIKQHKSLFEDPFKWSGVDTSKSVRVHFYNNIKSTKTPLFNSRIRLYNLQDKVKGYINLAPNWDSYSADMISFTAIKEALLVIDHLIASDIFSNGIEVNVFPMRDGGIQFEFDAEDLSAELEISPLGEMSLIVYDDEANIIDKLKICTEELTEISNILSDATYAKGLRNNK